MRSKNSFFNKTLFFKNCSRFWPLWAAYAIIWLTVVLVTKKTTRHLNEKLQKQKEA